MSNSTRRYGGNRKSEIKTEGSFAGIWIIFRIKKASVAWLCAGILVFLYSCIDPYDPDPLHGNTRFLIVEGYISMGDYSNITLSYSRGLKDTVSNTFENSAAVTIERDDEKSYQMLQKGNGVYTSAEAMNDTSRRYRIRIRLGTKTYISSFVQAKNAPPIDTLEPVFLPAGVSLLLTTHDPLQATHYYKWEYEETWQFHSAYLSVFCFNNDELIHRQKSDTANPESNVYDCWSSEKSKKIIIGNSVALGQDIIYKFPFAFVDTSNLKLQYKYSNLIRQRAITQEEYEYWEQIQKTSERMGSLFDPMPDNIRGNIRCVEDEKEIVVGYIGAGATSEKRMYVLNTDMPHYTLPYDLGTEEWKQRCPSLSVNFTDPNWRFSFHNDAVVPIDTYKIHYPDGQVDSGITFSYKKCVDCREFGTNTKPAFWED
jgi:hypothetical protein